MQIENVCKLITDVFFQAGKEANTARKDMNIGIFEIPRLFFSNGEDTRKYTYADYNDLFFQVQL